MLTSRSKQSTHVERPSIEEDRVSGVGVVVLEEELSLGQILLLPSV